MYLIRGLFVFVLAQSLALVATVHSQNSCVYEELQQPINFDADLLFMYSTEDALQVSTISSSDSSTIQSRFVLPADASQVSLNPSNLKIAYALIDNSEVISRRIMLLDLLTGESSEILESSEDDIPQIIDLRWIDETRLGFVSNGVEQAYTIVSINEGIVQTQSANIPIPERNVRGGSSFGDWDIVFSQDFSHAVFIDFRTPDQPIEVWDLESSTKLGIDNLPPVSWTGGSQGSRAYKWHPVEDVFWIREEISDWYSIDIENNQISKTADEDGLGILQFPAIHPDTNDAIFQAVLELEGQFIRNVVLLKNGVLESTCLETANAILNTDTAGWNSNGELYALTRINDLQNESVILVLDTNSLEFFRIHLDDSALAQLEILGWIQETEN